MDVTPGQADHLRDVLALTEAILSSDGPAPGRDWQAASEDIRVLLDHADLAGCLLTAAALFGGALQTISRIMAGAGEGSEAENLAWLLAEGRRNAGYLADG